MEKKNKKRKLTGIREVNPIDELRDDLAGKGIQVGITICVSLILSIFLTGLGYQIWKWVESIVTRRRFKFGLLNSFIYGVQHPIIFILIGFVFLFIAFRSFRSVRKSYQVNYEDGTLDAKRNTYGSSHYQTETELRTNFKITKTIEETTGDVFGADEKGNIYTFIYPPGMNKNKVYFGAPGSGKSAAVMKTSMYQNILQGNSIICTDTKGDLYKETARVFKKYGYKVKALMLKPQWFKNSDSFNMFVDLHPDDDDLDAKADVIANVIIKNTSGKDEGTDYWGTNEFNLIKCIVMHVSTNEQYIKSGRNNLPEVYNFLSTYSAKEMSGIFLGYPKDSVIRQCYDIFAACSDQNQGQIINGAAIRLGKLTNKALQKALSFNEMDMIAPMKEKCIYYIIISDTDDAYKFISSLFFSTIFNAQCEYSDNLTKQEKKKQLAVEYLCDEYYSTGGILGLPIKISTMRSRKIGITLILQNKGQLEAMYTPGEVETILNACTVKGLLSTNDMNTAQYFSDSMGTKTVMVENIRHNEDAADIIHAHGENVKSYGEGTKPLAMPADLMNGVFTRDHIIYVISGMPPVKLMKYFAEKGGEAIHPMEKEAQELGENPCFRHLPRWRKLMKLQEQEELKSIEVYKKKSEENENESEQGKETYSPIIKQKQNKLSSAKEENDRYVSKGDIFEKSNKGVSQGNRGLLLKEAEKPKVRKNELDNDWFD